MVRCDDGWFFDDAGRTLILRGCNLGGDCKVPYRPLNELPTIGEFHDYRGASFVGRPFPENEAAAHLDRLARWGFNVIRLLVTWEGLEPGAPGEYDDAYYDYIERVAAMAGERGIRVFVDPHQDAWSRWTGGDGAPAWTLEAVGFEPRSLHRSGAAFVHEYAGDPYPRMRWPSNYSRLGAATMFTLFFAGDDFAPSLKIDGKHARDFLQGRYIDAIARLMGRLSKYDAVIGVDALNEPGDGFIGATDLSRLEKALSKTGPMPTPFEAMAAGSGYPIEVGVYGVKGLAQGRIGSTTLGEHGLSAWKPGSECVWLREGVWDVSCGKPVLRKPDHFATVRGRAFDFNDDYLKPFAVRLGKAVAKAAGERRFNLFLETVPETGTPRWTPADTEAAGVAGLVNATHWYDGLTLYLKHWLGFAAYEKELDRVILGPKAVRRYFAAHLRRIRDSGLGAMGKAPSLVGEFGLPYDLNGAFAYRTGDYRLHVKALSAYYDAMDASLLSATIWDYTASNTHARGDGWNGEDLSIWNRDDFEAGRTETGDPRDAGGRALAGFVRPYARAVAGRPLSMRFYRRSGRFEFAFDPSRRGLGAAERKAAGAKVAGAAEAGDSGAETEIYLPDVQYPNGFGVSVSGGTHRVEDRDGYSLAFIVAEPGAARCSVTVERR